MPEYYSCNPAHYDIENEGGASRKNRGGREMFVCSGHATLLMLWMMGAWTVVEAELDGEEPVGESRNEQAGETGCSAQEAAPSPVACLILS